MSLTCGVSRFKILLHAWSLIPLRSGDPALDGDCEHLVGDTHLSTTRCPRCSRSPSSPPQISPQPPPRNSTGYPHREPARVGDEVVCARAALRRGVGRRGDAVRRTTSRSHTESRERERDIFVVYFFSRMALSPFFKHISDVCT